MANLVELYDLVIQAQSFNGVPLSHGHVYVYALGRTKLMDTWSDIDGESLNTNPVILDNAGQAHIYVSDDFDYTLVFTDEYDNEVFSVDKYLLSKGEHSHADVAVAPSEHIGVSSYHVGEVTVYVPYLTGEVGKTYEGIDPIVVNNTLNRISANHIPLGVQDPLYFVEDSESACILGCSAQTEIPSELSGKWDEASDAVIANSAQWAEGTEYEAGSYISIDGHTINVTGLQPEGDYAYNSALSSKLDVTALPQDLVHSGELTAYYPINNPSGFITGVDLSDYATNEDLQTVSADITAMIPTALTGDYLTKESADTLYQPIGNYLSSTDSANFLLTSTSGNFYPMEGNPSGFLTAHQSLQGYATEQWVEGKGYLTSVNIPESANWNATTNTVSSNSAAWGASNPQIPVTGINGIKISESGDQVVFEVSGDYYPGNNPSGFITGVDLSDYATTAQVSEKLDTTAFSDVSGDFLTAVDLTPYQLTADMTAYQEAGDYYSASNPSGFLTEIPQSALSGYVHISASNVAIGTSTKAINENTFVQGTRVSADRNAFAQGINASAVQMSLAQGNFCDARNYSLAQGAMCQARDGSLAQGSYGNASSYSLAQGEHTHAEDHSIANGYYVSAYNRSQAFGFGTKASGNQMTIGIHNKTTAGAAFVIGDGEASDKLSDSFIIWKDGSVSAKGNISANGVELGSIPEGTMNESAFEYNGSNKISAYNGSAFAGGGGGADYSAGDFIDITDDVISVDDVCDVSAGNGINIFQSANYVTIELGLSAGITDIALVNELPAEPIATVLYLIPET